MAEESCSRNMSPDCPQMILEDKIQSNMISCQHIADMEDMWEDRGFSVNPSSLVTKKFRWDCNIRGAEDASDAGLFRQDAISGRLDVPVDRIWASHQRPWCNVVCCVLRSQSMSMRASTPDP